jgi:protein TonB
MAPPSTAVVGAAAAPASAPERRRAAEPRRAALPRPAPPLRPRRHSVNRSSTRPAFLVAALITIIGGSGFLAYRSLYGVGRASDAAATESATPEAASPDSSSQRVAEVNAAPPPALLPARIVQQAVAATAPPPVPAAVPPPNAQAGTRAKPDDRKPLARDRAPRTTAGRQAARGPSARREAGPDLPPPPAAAVPAPAPPLAAQPVAAPAVVAPAQTLPEPAPTGRSFELADVDVKPEIARRVEPIYPAAARERGLEDVVIVRVLVSATGRPHQLRLLRHSRVDPAFDQAAIAAVGQWTFSPARKRDRAVDCWLNVGVPFRVPRDAGSR